MAALKYLNTLFWSFHSNKESHHFYHTLSAMNFVFEGIFFKSHMVISQFYYSFIF